MLAYLKQLLENILQECLTKGESLTSFFLCFCLHRVSVVRACKWGDGNQLFATASDPFHTRDNGAINIYTLPTEDMLVERKFAFLLSVSGANTYPFL